jgi:protocatechuate 3,4-dioxygenase beta subunit
MQSSRLQRDLKLMGDRLTARRRMLAMLASAGVSTFSPASWAQGPFGGVPPMPRGPQARTGAGNGMGGTGANTGNVFSADGACLADPPETNGPYPADGSNTANGVLSNVLGVEGVLRADIRTSFGMYMTQAAGVPVTLTLSLVNVNNACAPLAGYAIYIWHCDKDGKYSIYDLPYDNYLRGLQVADANGQVTFTTIFPGCYTGRYPHIHFEVYPSVESASSYRNAALTSQLAMPADIAKAVYAAEGYGASVAAFARVSLAGDNVFGSSTAAQLAAQTPALTGTVTGGYAATATIGLAV